MAEKDTKRKKSAQGFCDAVSFVAFADPSEKEMIRQKHRKDNLTRYRMWQFVPQKIREPIEREEKERASKRHTRRQFRRQKGRKVRHRRHHRRGRSRHRRGQRGKTSGCNSKSAASNKSNSSGSSDGSRRPRRRYKKRSKKGLSGVLARMYAMLTGKKKKQTKYKRKTKSRPSSRVADCASALIIIAPDNISTSRQPSYVAAPANVAYTCRTVMSKAPKRLHERRYITTSQPKTTRYEPPKFEDVDDDTWSTNLESPSIVFPIDTSSKPKLGATGILAAGEDGKLTTPRYSAIDPLRHLNADQNWKLKELKQASARFRSSGPMDQEEMLQLAEMKMQKTCQRIIWSNGQKIMHRNTQKANQGNTHDNKPDAPERQQSAASSVESMTSSVYSESDIAANGDSSSCNGKSRAEAESDEKAYTEASSVDPADNVRSSHPLISQVKRWMSSNKSHKSLDPNRGSIDKPPVLPESNIEGIFDEWIKPDDSISSVVPAALNVRREPVHHD